MSVKYVIRKTRLQEKDFYIGNIVINETFDTKKLIKRMMETESGLTEANIHAVINALTQNLKNILSDGNRVNIDGFLIFTPGMSGQFDSEIDGFLKGRNKIYINVRVSQKFNDAFFDITSIEKKTVDDKKPLLLSVKDLKSKETNSSITLNGIITIMGDYLKFEEGNRSEYLRFIDKQDSKKYIAVTEIQKITDKEIIFQMPITDITEGYFEIASQKSTNKLKVGKTAFNLVIINENK